MSSLTEDTNAISFWLPFFVGLSAKNDDRRKLLCETLEQIFKSGYISTLTSAIEFASELVNDPEECLGLDKGSLPIGLVVQTKHIGHMCFALRDFCAMKGDPIGDLTPDHVAEIKKIISCHNLFVGENDNKSCDLKGWIKNILGKQQTDQIILDKMVSICEKGHIYSSKVLMDIPFVSLQPSIICCSNEAHAAIIVARFRTLQGKIKNMQENYNIAVNADIKSSSISSTSAGSLHHGGGGGDKPKSSRVNTEESFGSENEETLYACTTCESHYDIIMQNAGQSAALLLQIAYHHTFPKSKFLICSQDNWIQAVDAREKGNHVSADNFVNLALQQCPAWLPFRHICAYIYLQNNSNNNGYTYLVPRIEYEALYLLEQVYNIQHSLGCKTADICKNDLFENNSHAWVQCCRQYCEDTTGNPCCTNRCSAPTHSPTESPRIYYCGKCRDSGKITSHNTALWDCPKWMHAISEWPDSFSVSKRALRPYFFFGGEKFASTDPRLIRQLAAVGSDYSLEEKNVRAIAYLLLKHRNAKSHMDNTWAVHTYICVAEFLHVAQQLCTTWIMKNNHSVDLCNAALIKCNETLTSVLTSKQLDFSSSTSNVSQWPIFASSINNFKNSGSLCVLLASPSCHAICRSALPAVDWTMVVDFSYEYEMSISQTALWSKFKNARDERLIPSTARHINDSQSIVYSGGDLPYKWLDDGHIDGLPWVQPFFGNGGSSVLSQNGSKLEVAESHVKNIVHCLKSVAIALSQKSANDSRLISVILPLYGAYSFPPTETRVASTTQFCFERKMRSTQTIQLQDAVFPKWSIYFLELLFSVNTYQSSVEVCILTDNELCCRRLMQSTPSTSCWPLSALSNLFKESYRIKFCVLKQSILELGYISSSAYSSHNRGINHSNGVRIFCDGVETVLCPNQSLLGRDAITASRLLEDKLRRCGLQLLHATLPTDSMKNMRSDLSFDRFLSGQEGPSDSKGAAGLPPTVKYVALNFFAGEKAEWVLVCNDLALQYGCVFAAPRLQQYNSICSQVRTLWKDAQTHTSRLNWKFYIEHGYRYGGTTIAMQVIWNEMFRAQHAGIFQVLSEICANPTSEALSVIKDSIKLIYSLTKKPVVFFIDRCVDQERIVDMIASTCPLTPLFFIIVRRTSTTLPGKFCDKFVLGKQTDFDMSRMSSALERVIREISKDDKFSVRDVEDKLVKSKKLSAQETRQFLRMKGIMYLKSLNNEAMCKAWNNFIESWVFVCVSKVFEKRLQNPSVLRSLHTLCYVAIIQECWEKCSGFNVDSLKPLLSDGDEERLFVDGVDEVESAVLRRSFDNVNAQFETSEGSCAAESGVYFPFVRRSTTIESSEDVHSVDEVNTISKRSINLILNNFTRSFDTPPPVKLQKHDSVNLSIDVVQTLMNNFQVQSEDEFWHEMLYYDDSKVIKTIRFRHEMGPLFLQALLRLEQSCPQPAKCKILRTTAPYNKQFYHVVLRLLFALMRYPEQSSILNQYRATNDPDHHDVPLSIRSGILWRAQHVFIEKQVSIVDEDPNDRLLHSWAVSQVLGVFEGKKHKLVPLAPPANDSPPIPAAVLGCIPGVQISPMRVFISAQCVFWGRWKLSASTIRYMVAMIEFYSKSARALNSSVSNDGNYSIDDFIAHSVIIYAGIVSRSLMSTREIPSVQQDSVDNTLHYNHLYRGRFSKSSSFEMLGNATRNMVLLIAEAVFEKIKLSVKAVRADTPAASPIIKVAIAEVAGLFALGNIARFWYWESTEEINDQIPPLADEISLWILLLKTVKRIWSQIAKLDRTLSIYQFQNISFETDITAIVGDWKSYFRQHSVSTSIQHVQDSRKLKQLNSINDIMQTISDKLRKMRIAIIQCKVGLETEAYYDRLSKSQMQFLELENFLMNQSDCNPFWYWLDALDSTKKMWWICDVEDVQVKMFALGKQKSSLYQTIKSRNIVNGCCKWEHQKNNLRCIQFDENHKKELRVSVYGRVSSTKPGIKESPTVIAEGLLQFDSSQSLTTAALTKSIFDNPNAFICQGKIEVCYSFNEQLNNSLQCVISSVAITSELRKNALFIIMKNIIRTAFSYYNCGRDTFHNTKLMLKTDEKTRISTVLRLIYSERKALDYYDDFIVTFIEYSSYAGITSNVINTNVDDTIVVIEEWINFIDKNQLGRASTRLAESYLVMCLFIKIAGKCKADGNFVRSQNHMDLVERVHKLNGQQQEQLMFKNGTWIAGTLKQKSGSDWNESCSTGKYVYVHPLSSPVPLDYVPMSVRQRFSYAQELTQLEPELTVGMLTPQILTGKIIAISKDHLNQRNKLYIKGVIMLIPLTIHLQFSLDHTEQNLSLQLHDLCSVVIQFWSYGIDVSNISKMDGASNLAISCNRNGLEEEEETASVSLHECISSRRLFLFKHDSNDQTLPVRVVPESHLSFTDASSLSEQIHNLISGVVGRQMDGKLTLEMIKAKDSCIVLVPVKCLGDLTLPNNSNLLSVLWLATSIVACTMNISRTELDRSVLLPALIDPAKLVSKFINFGTILKVLFCTKSRQVVCINSGLLVVGTSTPSANSITTTDNKGFDIGLIQFSNEMFQAHDVLEVVRMINAEMNNAIDSCEVSGVVNADITQRLDGNSLASKVKACSVTSVNAHDNLKDTANNGNAAPNISPPNALTATTMAPTKTISYASALLGNTNKPTTSKAVLGNTNKATAEVVNKSPKKGKKFKGKSFNTVFGF